MMTAPKASSARPIRRVWQRRLFAAAVALVGLFLCGNGLYIKAKASVAQILLERAWADTLPRFAKRPASLDEGRYQRFAEFMAEAGLISTVVPVETYAVEITFMVLILLGIFLH